jgi:cytochrome c peroxidase
MKNKLFYVFLSSFVLFWVLLATSQDGITGKVITKKDVKFKVPKDWPEPHYDVKSNKPTVAGFVLGRSLFYDNILSSDSTVSCSFCHQINAAFAHTDHSISHGVRGRIGTRNVPPLQNLAWQNSFMWDGGINHLDFQAIAPITAANEMNETIKNVLFKINRRLDFRTQFYNAFKDSVPNTENMMKALSQFTLSMVSANSRYDRYVQGKDTLSALELKGLKIAEEKCFSCHIPPLFTSNKLMSNGLPIDSFILDKGAFMLDFDSTLYLKFRTPSLRNVMYTYPYMHDGRINSLDAVLDYYAKGEFNKMANDEVFAIGTLTQEDKKALKSFLESLTDYDFLRDTRFIDPNTTMFFYVK